MKIAIKRILLILITSATFVACNYDDNGNVPAIMFNPGCAMEPVFAFDGGSEDYLFMTSYSWTATPADDWVSITPASGTKDENTFTITVEPNPLGEDRTSSVEVKLSTGKRVTIPITQQMHPVYESESSPLIALSAENAQRDIAIRTNQKFHITIARDAIWLSVRATRSVEDNVLHLTATDNLTTSSRFTTVYVLNDESELLERFDVVQASKLPALNEVVYRTNDKSLVKIGMGEGYGSRFLAHLYDEERDCGRIIFDYVVRTIPENAFKDCSNITSFELPANLTMIGAGAFSGCSGCSEFTLPSQIEILGEGAFNGCKGELTTNCYIPNESCAASEPDHWLYGSEFSKVYINSNIGSGTFFDYDVLDEVFLSPDVNNIHNRAFEDCDNLTAIHINSLAEWCDITFGGPTANPLNGQQCKLVVDDNVVTELITTDGMRTIGQYSFYNYAPLRRIVLNDCTTSIGACAFAKCDVESITLGESIVSVGNLAFNECHTEQLIIDGNIKPQTTTGSTSRHWFSGIVAENVTFTDNCSIVTEMLLSDIEMHNLAIASTVKEIRSGAFAGCKTLENVDFGSGLKYIGSHAFYGCTTLTDIELPASLTTIDGYAFKGCTGFESITIPASVNFIGEYAFYDCTNLREIYIEATTPPTLGSDYVFDGHPDNQKIYVPMAAVDAYKSAPRWRRYAGQIYGY